MNSSNLIDRTIELWQEIFAQRLGGRPVGRILVTHYPVRLADGRRENRTHRLRDLDALVDVARRHGVGLWLHGHRHHAYEHAAGEETPFAHICAGSATQRGAWSYRVYTLDGVQLTATRREYDPATGRFRDVSRFQTDL